MQGTSASSCIFCRIAAGEIPAKRVAESPHAIAFRDVNAQAPTHVLLIPREHVVASASDLTVAHGALLGELFELAARVARDEQLENGWRLVINVGPHAGQTVLHLHVHLLGGRPMHWPPG